MDAEWKVLLMVDYYGQFVADEQAADEIEQQQLQEEALSRMTAGQQASEFNQQNVPRAMQKQLSARYNFGNAPIPPPPQPQTELGKGRPLGGQPVDFIPLTPKEKIETQITNNRSQSEDFMTIAKEAKASGNLEKFNKYKRFADESNRRVQSLNNEAELTNREELADHLSILGSVRDDDSLNHALTLAKVRGIDTSSLEKYSAGVYDKSTKSYIDRLILHSKQRINQIDTDRMIASDYTADAEDLESFRKIELANKVANAKEARSREGALGAYSKSMERNVSSMLNSRLNDVRNRLIGKEEQLAKVTPDRVMSDFQKFWEEEGADRKEALSKLGTRDPSLAALERGILDDLATPEGFARQRFGINPFAKAEDRSAEIRDRASQLPPMAILQKEYEQFTSQLPDPAMLVQIKDTDPRTYDSLSRALAIGKSFETYVEAVYGKLPDGSEEEPVIGYTNSPEGIHELTPSKISQIQMETRLPSSKIKNLLDIDEGASDFINGYYEGI